MPSPEEPLSIGELAARAGVATSALRFYEEQDLIRSERTSGNQRRYPRSTLRRIAVIRAAQAVGISLAGVRHALEALPAGRNPTTRDWARMSREWSATLEERIEALTRLRTQLDDCIGCGCLSLQDCSLVNEDDRMARRGPGARFWLGDEPG